MHVSIANAYSCIPITRYSFFTVPLQFVGGRVEASDQRVKKRSERAVELEQAHKAIVDKLELSDYEIKPIPRPVDK